MLNIFKKQTPEQKQAWQKMVEEANQASAQHMKSALAKHYKLDQNKSYVVIESMTQTELEEAVGVAIELGYEPVGSMTVNDLLGWNQYFQAVQKRG